MEKRGDILSREDVSLLNQLIRAMQDISEKMNNFYERKNVTKFNAAKKELLQLQRRISEII